MNKSNDSRAISKFWQFFSEKCVDKNSTIGPISKSNTSPKFSTCSQPLQGIDSLNKTNANTPNVKGGLQCASSFKNTTMI